MRIEHRKIQETRDEPHVLLTEQEAKTLFAVMDPSVKSDMGVYDICDLTGKFMYLAINSVTVLKGVIDVVCENHGQS